MIKKYLHFLNIICFSFFLLLLFTNTLQAVGIATNENLEEIVFEPGAKRTFQFYVRNNQPEPMDILLSIEGDLASYFFLEEEIIKNISPNHYAPFKVFMILPSNKEDIGEPGMHRALVSATETSTGENLVGAKGKIRVPLEVRVRHPGKYLRTKLSMEKDFWLVTKFSLDLFNEGSETIDLITGKLLILDAHNDTIAQTSFPRVNSFEKDDNLKLFTEFNINKLIKGEYHAKAEVSYDGSSTESNTISFRKGEIDINLINYTSYFKKGKINKFFLTVENEWNNPLKDVYLFINITQPKSDYSFKQKTAAFDLEPWEEKTIQTYWDNTNTSQGEYQARISIFYEDKQSEESVLLWVIKEGGEVKKEIDSPSPSLLSSPNISLFVILTVLFFLVIINLILLLIVLWNKKKTKK